VVAAALVDHPLTGVTVDVVRDRVGVELARLFDEHTADLPSVD
jgi:hypothetical protein